MANSEHLDILKKGVKFWNQWREDSFHIITPDLTRADLSSADLTGADLISVDLTGADLRSADLSSADLSGAELRIADLSSADLNSANLNGANLNSADLKNADLRDTVLSFADLTDAALTGADLTGADLTGADLSGADLTSADLRGADLTDADLTGAVGANLSEKQKKQALYETKNINVGMEHNLQSQMQTIREELEEKIKQSQNPFTQTEDKAALKKIVINTIQQNIADNLVDKFGEDLQKRTKYASLKADITKYITDNYNASSSRYGDYGKNSRIEAKHYQWAGFTLLAIGILVPLTMFCIILFAQWPDHKQWDKVFMTTPLTLLSEGLAFFLFSLSQKEKERMRAFSSEQCNLDLQKAGYLSLVKSSTLPKLSEHLARLSETKQPYILKKNERTIEESHNKNNIDALKDMAEIIKPVISK